MEILLSFFRFHKASKLLIALISFMSLGCTMDASILSDLASGGSSVVTPAVPLVLEATENKILYSGESLQFNITGGTPPYTFETDSRGRFEPTGMFYAGYNYNSMNMETVTVRDSVGQTASYTVPIKSFVNQEVFNLAQAGVGARSNQIISTPDGTLFVVGYTGRNSTNWLVLKSIDNGATWTAVDTQYASQPMSVANAIATDSAGHIYVVGASHVSGKTGKNLILRKSIDQGLNWSTVREFQGFANQDSIGVDIAIGSGDQVFVLASIENASETIDWVLQKSSNGGTTWDSFTIALNEAATSLPKTIAVSLSQSNHIFVGGKSAGYYTVRATYDGGTSWAIIDQVTRGGHVNSIAISPTGVLFSAGTVDFVASTAGSPSGSTGDHGILRVSSDNGVTWAYADHTAQLDAEYTDIAFSPNYVSDGRVYTSTFFTDWQSPFWDSHYIIRESEDFGITWIEKEKVQLVTNIDSVAVSLAFHPGGDLFSTGFAATSALDVNKNLFSLLVRKVNFLGAPFANLLNYNPVGKRFSKGIAITRTPTGDLYAVGDAENVVNLRSNWVVRKSTDNGLTWTTVDTVECGDFGCNAFDITSDADGRIYVIGENNGNSTNDFFWMVRRSLDNGATWSSNTWQLSATKPAYGKAIKVFPNGNVIAVGQAFDAAFQIQGIVRRSTDYGATWTTISTVANSNMVSMVLDGASTVYTAGGKIRRSTDGGSTWTDILSLASTSLSDVTIHNSKIYAIGRDFTVGSAQLQKVFRSSDNGITWETIDSFSSGSGDPTSIIVKSDQEIFYSGAYLDSDDQSGLVRWTKDGGTTWSILEKSQQTSGYSGIVNQLIFCSSDLTKICHIGFAADSNGIDSWIFRYLNL